MAVVILVTALYFQVQTSYYYYWLAEAEVALYFQFSSANVREANFLNSVNTSSTNNESHALISEFVNKKSKPTE